LRNNGTFIARQRVGKHVPEEANLSNNGTFIARQRVGKHVPEEANLRNNRQRSCKHASLTIEDGVFCGIRAEELS
jgi:hypothetical protein